MRLKFCTRHFCLLLICLPAAMVQVGVGCGVAVGQQAEVSAQPFRSPKDLVEAMLVQEDATHHDHYEYLATERSDRTGGHLWTERIVEVPAGRVRLLLAEDGKPLDADRMKAEHDRLAAIEADPAEFERRETAQKNDELHARQMLALLPKAFLLENVSLAGGVWRMEYRPDPAYSPSGVEEHVLHGMVGWLTIDARDMRLIHIEGRMPDDMSMAMGLVSIKAGSHFTSDRQHLSGHWRTVHLLTDIRGKAALFKTVAKNSDVTRSEFRYLAADLSTAQAAALLEAGK